MSDYRVVIRVKNNKLANLMKAKGIQTQAELARAIKTNTTVIASVANLRVGAYNADGAPSKITQKLCDYFGCLPEDIYPKEVLAVGLPKNVIEKIVSSEQVALYIKQAELDPCMQLESLDKSKFLETELRRLKPRHQAVIRKRYFENKLQSVIAKELDISISRVQQLEKEAIRRFRKIIGSDTDEELGIFSRFDEAVKKNVNHMGIDYD